MHFLAEGVEAGMAGSFMQLKAQKLRITRMRDEAAVDEKSRCVGAVRLFCP